MIYQQWWTWHTSQLKSATWAAAVVDVASLITLLMQLSQLSAYDRDVHRKCLNLSKDFKNVYVNCLNKIKMLLKQNLLKVKFKVKDVKMTSNDQYCWSQSDLTAMRSGWNQQYNFPSHQHYKSCLNSENVSLTCHECDTSYVKFMLHHRQTFVLTCPSYLLCVKEGLIINLLYIWK